ncbi:MAG: YfiR family protein [Cyclobacteriaceae bacterium]|nr:YfiR family protein [Cyclobacteriaceae bacterium]
MFVLFLLFDLSIVAQKAKYQCDIIFKLSQYVTWPENYEDYKFVIGVVGSVKDFESFQELALKKGRSQNYPIEVRYFDCLEAIDECHLLYVSEEFKIQIEKIVKRTKKEPVLIVSAKNGYGASGSIINFVESDGKLKIEFNKAQAERRGLQVSDKLKNIAIVI